MENFNGPMFEALEELDKRLLENHYSPITLKCAGGFALMVNNVRPQNGITDIDYVGPELSREVKSISEEVGKEFGMPEKWINNDLLLTGTSLEDLEYSTGILHFNPVKTNLKNIRLEVLSPEDLLRMKIIAIDTNFVAIDYGGDFTRLKDFADIINLMELLKYDIKDLRLNYEDYLLGSQTLTAVKVYKEYGDEGIKEMVKKIQLNHLKLSEEKKKTKEEYKRSEVIDKMLNKAMDDNLR